MMQKPTTTARRRLSIAATLALTALAALMVVPEAMARDRAFLGISSRSLSGRDARNLDLDRRDGALIERVYHDTAADEAGLKKGDVIVEFDGERVFDDSDLGDMIRDHDSGDEVTIEIIRDGKRKTLQATLGSQEDRTFSGVLSGLGQGIFSDPDSDAPMAFSFGSTWRRPQLGVNIMELNSQLAEYFEVEDQRGVLVTRVARRSAAADAGIEAGDVIVEVAGERVVRSGDISDALEGRWGEDVVVEVVRKGSRREITVELGDKDDDD